MTKHTRSQTVHANAWWCCIVRVSDGVDFDGASCRVNEHAPDKRKAGAEAPAKLSTQHDLVVELRYEAVAVGEGLTRTLAGLDERIRLGYELHPVRCFFDAHLTHNVEVSEEVVGMAILLDNKLGGAVHHGTASNLVTHRIRI